MIVFRRLEEANAKRQERVQDLLDKLILMNDHVLNLRRTQAYLEDVHRLINGLDAPGREAISTALTTGMARVLGIYIGELESMAGADGQLTEYADMIEKLRQQA